MASISNSSSSNEMGTIKVMVEDVKGRSTTLRLNHEESTNFREDMAAEMIERNPYVRLYMTIVWIIATAVFILFLYQITTQYMSGLSTPSSSISIEPSSSLPIPKVVICNWNQDGTLQAPSPTYQCAQCNISLASCTVEADTSDCSVEWIHTPIETRAGLFDCWTYNGDYKNPKWSTTTGYSGSISTIWQVPLYPATAPPTNRAGAQVSFIILDDTATDPEVIYDEVGYASVGTDSFYAITYVNIIHDEVNRPKGTPYNASRYEAVSSSVSLNVPYNESFGYIGISFAFETLSKETDQFFTAYTLSNFWGDFAGMVGTLMGLDAIKFSSGIPKAYVAIKLRSMNPLEDHFNG